MALANGWIHAWPVSPAIAYVAIGTSIGPAGLAFFDLSLTQHARWVESLTEVVVLISLFAVGLKLRIPLYHAAWRVPMRLATVGMIVTIVLAALAAWITLRLPLAACVVLAAFLAPTLWRSKSSWCSGSSL